MQKHNKTTWWKIPQIRLPLGEPESNLTQIAATQLELDPEQITDCQILRKSLDSRRRDPHLVYTLQLGVKTIKKTGLESYGIELPEPQTIHTFPEGLISKKTKPCKVVIVGMGPAGLFGALTLQYAGLRPIVLEQGHVVQERTKFINRLLRQGELDPFTNVCFGEGGAGTYSDGKLNTRKSHTAIPSILKLLTEFGAPSRITRDTNPHIGTDKLIPVLKNFHQKLSQRCELRCSTRVTELVISKDRVVGVKTSEGETIKADKVILAVGHSARDMYQHLSTLELGLVPKPFAVGFRIEHPQSFINSVRYGKSSKKFSLPPAEYKLTHNVGQGKARRGIYSFCMCPGGRIVPTPTEPDGLVVNGMSPSNRGGRYGNAAIVVSVGPEQWGPSHGLDPLSGIAFQRYLEQLAYKHGGEDFQAPAGRASDLLQRKCSTSLPHSTYSRGIRPVALHKLFPDIIMDPLVAGLKSFEQKMPGFCGEHGLLVGIETRTSAPVRIPRKKNYESVGLNGLYPCGEGAGYAGGIMSCALDGFSVARSIIEELKDQ